MNIQIVVKYVSETETTHETYIGDFDVFSQIEVGDNWRLDDNGDAILWTVSKRIFDIATQPSTGLIEASQLRFTLTA